MPWSYGISSKGTLYLHLTGLNWKAFIVDCIFAGSNWFALKKMHGFCVFVLGFLEFAGHRFIWGGWATRLLPSFLPYICSLITWRRRNVLAASECWGIGCLSFWVSGRIYSMSGYTCYSLSPKGWIDSASTSQGSRLSRSPGTILLHLGRRWNGLY